MKTTVKILMTVMVMLSVFGCNKDEVKVDDYQELIVGEWQVYAEEGYEWDFDGETFTPGYYFYPYYADDSWVGYAVYNKDGGYYYYENDAGDEQEHSGTYYIVKDKIHHHSDYDFFTEKGEYIHDFTHTLGFDGRDVMYIVWPQVESDADWLERIRNEYGDDICDYVKGEVEKLNFRLIYHRIK